MDTFDLRVATPADAPAIAALANRYTYQQLDATQRQGGFLTGSFAAPGVQAMLASVPGQVAYHQGELIGFIINSRLAPASYPPLVQEICAVLPALFYRQRALADYQWFFYGPVLVQQAYRGHGLLQRLFRASQAELAGRFDLGIAFIAAENAASLHVHTQKLGLEVVGKVVFQGTAYAILAFAVG
jgi:L-amino acid N-acyltransferase YncA